MWGKAVAWIPGAVMAAIMFAAQVGPDEAASNLSKWFIKAGGESVPLWLYSRSADSWAFWIGLVGFILWAAWLLCYKLNNKRVAGYIKNIFKCGHIDGLPSGIIKLELQNTDETQTDRDQNRRCVPLRIEFSGKREFKYEGMSNEYGMPTGHIQSYHVMVHNRTARDIDDVQVWLTDISPMPPEFDGNIPVPLHVAHESKEVNRMQLSAGEKRLVDVITLYDRSYRFELYIRHTSTKSKQEIFLAVDEYQIELQVRGRGVEPCSRKFNIHVRKGNEKKLLMESVPQSESDAFHEGADEEFTGMQIL